MSAHARVMPSALHLTVPCPGSLQLQERVPPTPTTYEQAEGIGLHLVSMKRAMGAKEEWPLGRKFEIDRHQLEVDDDMIDASILYENETTIGGRFEEPVNIPDVHPTECFGTPDFWYLSTHGILRVVDLKGGHRYVDVFENYQLFAYAAGIIRFLNLPADTVVVLVIVQPYNYTHGAVRTWKTTAGQVMQFVHEVILPRVELALSPNPPTFTGRHCLDCRARTQCATLQRADASIVDFSGTAEAVDLSPAAVGQELRILKEATKRLEARYTGLYEQASNLSRSGVSIAFWHMESGRGKFDWKSDTTTDKVADMGDLLGIPLRKPAKLITPTQAIKAGLDESVVTLYADRPPGALRLVQDDMTAFRKIFGANKT